MTLKLSQLSNTRMDVELLKVINADMKWNVTRKNRTSMTRRPRKPGAGGFEWVCSVHELAENKKVIDGSSKKRRFLHQSTSKRSKTPCIKGEDGMSPGPQTPSVCYEDIGQRCWSSSLPLSKSQKAKSKSRLRNSKTKKTKKGVQNLIDFSGIALLADVACSISVQEATYRVEDFSMSKECTKPEVKIGNTCGVDVKEGIVSPGSNGSAVQPNVNDIGTEVEEKKVAPSKGLRLHWDLNTVMDDWEDPCDDMQIESVKHEDTFISVAPLLETCNAVSTEKTYDKKTVTVKTSDGESCASKCEDFLTSPTSVLKEQSVANCETDTIDGLKLDQQRVSTEVIQGVCDKKVTTEDRVIECCGSNVEVDYDSPFEDGELREPIEKPEKETVCNESDNIYTDEFGTIGNSLLGKVDHGQTMDNQHSLLVKAVPKNDTDQDMQVDAFERPRTDEPEKDICERKEFRLDESTSFDVCRNGEYLHQSRSSNIGDSTVREYDLKSHRSLDRNYSRNYNSRGGPGGGYRTQDRRPSPPERNNGYGSYRGPPLARSHSRDRYRYHSQEYHDPKPHFTPNFNRPSAQPRSRSRSGSPIAWNFQKHKNSDTNSSGEIKTGTRGGHVSPDRSSKCFDDHHRFKDGQFRDKRQPSVTQRYEPTGYFEKQKPDDYYRFNQRSARFSQMNGYKYKDNSDDFRKHDGYYDKANRVGRSVDDGARRFRYANNRE
ncbi:uncharacterized protein LOC143581567 [Bidens hawaiensis]|uniref:uncharacterized protein LOC143581567 n=1 Tax=Bidens hawaiensis TaxID=980011 RepID=UPI00404A52B3